MSASLTVREGDDDTLDLAVTNDDGSASNITAGSLVLGFFDWAGQAVLTKASTGVSPGIIITDGLNGLATVELLHGDLIDHEGVFAWELQLKTAAAKLHTVGRGRVRVQDQLITST